ncbi:CCA tRNA nucleotidyltransferase [Patescibacteria group bacterium]|nr:MAG: CCA tRNA nucleotidyltransferase [Patescibacteria group bacterium]
MLKTKQNQVGPFREWFGGLAPPLWARAILKKQGAELYVVGGAVRDALLGRKDRRDLDLVVRGIPLTALTRLLKKFGAVNEVGRTFGVLKFVPRGQKDGAAIDIALPRTEFSFGTGGYKDVETKSRHTLPLTQDLQRRDFTVNAMAWDLGAGALFDPLGGERDLSKKILRAVGAPAARFKEDYTRILRLLRFSVELGFAIHPATWSAAKKLAPRLNDRRAGQWVVPRELVAKELLKAFATDPLAAFDFFDRAGIWRVLVPEIEAMKRVPQPKEYHTEGDVWQHTRLALQTLVWSKFAKKFPDGWDAETALGVLFHDIGKPPTLKTPEKHGVDRVRFDGHDKQGSHMTRAVAERLALSSYKAPRVDVSPERLEWIVAHHLLMVSADIEELRPRTIEKYFLSEKNPGDSLRKIMFCDVAATLSRNGRPFWTSFNALERRIKKIAVRQTKKGEMPKALLNGDEIMRAVKIKPGPAVGKLIAALRDKQLAGKVKNKKAALKLVRSIAGKLD